MYVRQRLFSHVLTINRNVLFALSLPLEPASRIKVEVAAGPALIFPIHFPIPNPKQTL